MAEILHDGEFWLPPKFLADDGDDIVSPKNNDFDDDLASTALFPSEFPYGGFGSYRVPSELSSPETESDEEEHQMAELTQRMARSTLQASEKSTGRFVSGSPQSTLCAFGNGCGCRKDSSRGSPTDVCGMSSQRATWDLLHAAAGEVERIRLSDERRRFMHHSGSGGLQVPQRNHSPVALPLKKSTNIPDLGFYTQQELLFQQQQLQIAQFQMLTEQQIVKQENNSVWDAQTKPSASAGLFHYPMVPNRARNCVVGGGRNTVRTQSLSSSAWPPLQHSKQHTSQNQQYGSGMKAIFLTNPSGKRECAGTGVFLPRRADCPAESRKKPACSTVLVPARVMQALNLKLDDMVGPQPQHIHRFNGAINMGNASAVPRLRSYCVRSQQKHNLGPQQQPVHQEIKLPQEWTY